MKKTTEKLKKRPFRKSELSLQKLRPFLFEKGKFVRFQTEYKDKNFIQDEGYIVSSSWKDENEKVAIYDLITMKGDRFRIITDPEKYPKDTII